MKKKLCIPLALTTLRIFLGPFALYCASCSWPRIWFLPVMIIALLSDIYDGVLARRFNVSTPQLRRYDSFTDIVFYIFILISTAMVVPSLIVNHWLAIAIALVAETTCFLMALIKFHRLASAHSYLAKIFGLALFAGLTTILCLGDSAWILPALSAICVVVNAEIILMMLLTNQPPVDVLSVFQLIRPKTDSRITSGAALKRQLAP